MTRPVRRTRALALGLLVASMTPGAAFADQATPASVAAPPQAAPVAAVPFPNRVNSALPSWLRLRGEFRERLEGFDGLGFNGTRQDLYWLSRLRLNATIAPSKSLSFVVQAQDARVGRKTVGPTGTPFRAPFDLRMAFADVGAASGPATVRLGRQELAFGDQRLVGHVSWLNAARTFDGGKLTLRTKGLQLDTFAASVVRIMETGFDRSGGGNRFLGAYLTAAVPNGSFEPYVFFRRDARLTGEAGVTGDLSATTIGARVAGRLPAALDYNVEMALQRGGLGANDVSAWAGHWQLRETLKTRGTPKITGEYNYASGDKDPNDGVRNTFDQLFPTPHDKYGLADQVGWKNIHHLRSGFEFTPVKGLPIATNYHSWWLAERRDGLYNVASAIVARIQAGAADRHVGQEIDVQVTKALFPQLQLAAGYAHIFPGAFLKEATPGASYSHPYVMATYVFLADK